MPVGRPSPVRLAPYTSVTPVTCWDTIRTGQGGQRVMSQARVAGTAVSVMLISSCASGGIEASEPQPTVTVTETVTATPEPEPEPEVEPDEDIPEDLSDVPVPEDLDEVDGAGLLGDIVVSYGVEMTVHDAYLADSIPWNESGQRVGSPSYAITDLSAESGQWFVVETMVHNVGATSMDLTCGWPVDAVAVDVQEREFDTFNSLYKYENNPRCNDNLQPGFEAEMTYVFNVPDDAQMLAMAFRDTEESAWGEYSAFLFDPAES